MVPDKVAKREKKLLEKELEHLYKAFFSFARCEYKTGDESISRDIKSGPGLKKLVKEKAKDLLEEGEAYIRFHSFRIAIKRKEASPEHLLMLSPLRNYYFFLQFTLYQENPSLLKEIEKLGEIFSFSITRIDRDCYLLELN